MKTKNITIALFILLSASLAAGGDVIVKNGEINAAKNITAAYYFGDGSALTNIPWNYNQTLNLNLAQYLSTFNSTYSLWAYNQTVGLDYAGFYADSDTVYNGSTYNGTYALGIPYAKNIFDQSLNSTSKVNFSRLLVNDSAGGVSILNVGDDLLLPVTAVSGFRVMQYIDDNIYIDFKTISGGFIRFRAGEGAGNPYDITWMGVDSTNGDVNVYSNLNVSKSMNVSQLRVGLAGGDVVAPLEVSRVNDNGIILWLSNGGYGFGFNRSSSTGALSIQGNQEGYNNILLAPRSGNVGIGTTSPGTALEVVGTTSTTALEVGTGKSFMGNQLNITDGGLVLSDFATYLYIQDTTANTDDYVIFIDGGFFNLRLDKGDDGSYEDSIIAFNGSGGRYGFGDASPDSTLDIVGVYSDIVSGTTRSLVINSSGVIGYVSSSARYKENIANVTKDAIQKIFGLNPRIYDRKGGVKGEVGLIAEEVVKVLPELVTNATRKEKECKTDADGIETCETVLVDLGYPENVEYSKLPAYLLAALQDLKQENELLKSELCKKDKTYAWCT